jgi:uncharacterized protein (TIGR00369 family)
MTNEEILLRRITDSFERQGLMRHLGARLVRVAPGLCEIVLPYSEKVTQQQDSFHGGAIGAIADIACGYAGLTLAEPGVEVVSVEYKINFLASFQGGELRATGHVVKAGRRLTVGTAHVTHIATDGQESACAVMQQTLMSVPKTY